MQNILQYFCRHFFKLPPLLPSFVMSDFVGKVVLVTGASGGIGAATAKIFAEHGATLAITGRNRKRLKEVAEECRHLGARDVLTITAEFLKLEDVTKVFDATIKRFSKLDVLVNNVGIGIHLRLAECSVEQLDMLFNINVKSAFHLTRLAMPYLIQTNGNIVNVSTVASMRPFTNDIAYGMTKAALDQLTRIVALDYAPKGVRVNSVNPGYVKTSRRLRRFSPEELKHYNNVIEPLHPMGRGGNPDEIAKAIFFLASDASSWTTGHCLVVDGGRLLTKSVPKVKSRL